MPLIDTPMPSPEGAQAGSTALWKLPIGRRYHSLSLTYSGVTLAQMKEVRVLVNGKPFQRFTANWRDKRNQQLGLKAAGGILLIPFDRVGLKRRDQIEQTAINTDSLDENGRGIRSFAIEIDIDEGAAGPVVLKMEAQQSEKIGGGAGTMLHIGKYPRSIAGAGELQIADIVYGGVTTQALNCVWFEPSAGIITKGKVERDTYTIWSRSAALNTRRQENGVRVPSGTDFVIDKTETGYGGDPIVLTGAQDFRYFLECSAAMTVNCMVETLGALGD